MRAILFALLLAGCTQNKLTVFTEYLSIETLPSFIVGTPDPRLYNPDVGEKLHIKWYIPPQEYSCDLKLELSLHFGNRTEEKVSVDLFTQSGIYIYPLINDAYWEKEGIFSYQVELFSAGTLIDCWKHLLYTERIKLSDLE